MKLRAQLPLPPGFRVEDVLAFHRRDAQQLAERVTEDGLSKGLVRDGRPTCLTIRFRDGLVQAELASDGPGSEGADEALARLVSRMLGLDQPVAEFEQTHHAHPALGPLIAARPGLRVPLAATPFEALSWAITGQQISVAAALTLRRNLVRACALAHSGGLACYPDAERVADLDEGSLRAAGFSGAKTLTLLGLARAVAEGRLPLDAWCEDLRPEAVREVLLAVRGIGPWTVDYTLLRGFGWLDGSLHGDAAVRRGLQVLLGSAERIGEAEAKRWLATFSPWRALVAAHLWAARPLPGGG